jgi:hypothetical protein
MQTESSEIIKKGTTHGESGDTTIDLYLIKDRDYYIVEAYEWFENERTGSWRGKYKVIPAVFTDLAAAEQYYNQFSDEQ